MQLRSVSFQWKARDDGRTYLGLIAQEVELIVPEAIEKDPDPATPLGLNYSSLVPVLIKSMQEQQITIKHRDAEIKALKTENARLKERQTELETRLAALAQAVQQLAGSLSNCWKVRGTFSAARFCYPD
jgi:predicted RNase H-like nuclease (RuvC/YqgF family)